MIRKNPILIATLAMIFALIPGAASGDTQFDDVPDHHPFASEIEWLAEQGTTRGCNPPANTRFCPNASVTRGQMAAFLSRALGLVNTGTVNFVDDDGSVFEKSIEKLAAAGITSGCNPPTNDRYCPNDIVTRGQMAAFLVRGLGLSERGGERFVDDDESVFEEDIERLAAAGITTGCNPPTNNRYCPNDAITRAQMAGFLHRALAPAQEEPEEPEQPEEPEPVPDFLPDSRRIDWNPGVPGGIPNGPETVRVTSYGARGDDGTDDAAAFQAAIDSLPASGGVVYVPAGRFVLRQTLRLDDGAVLRGAGSEATSLEFDLGGTSDAAIRVVDYDAGSWVGVNGGFQKGSRTLTLASTSGISAPTYAEIQQTNDAAVMYTEPRWNVGWAEDSVGEMVRIVAVSGNTVTLESPLNITYRAELAPILRTVDMVERAGIEQLRLRRVDNGNGHTIFMHHTAHSWIREVQSDMAGRSHIAVAGSLGCEIRDSYFDDAHNHGEPGRGYGVNLDLHVTGCLVENNAFASLRHSMMVQLGANGNVFGYNYSHGSHDAFGNVLADISVHGHYPFMNLFEGNVVDEIGISDWWGPAGPGNTMFRNCVKTEGVLIEDHSHRQNLIGNVLIGSPDVIAMEPSVGQTLAHGNYEGGSVRWDPTIAIRDIPASYYLTSSPSFYGGAPWPSTGSDRLGSCTNPARQRLESGNPVP